MLKPNLATSLPRRAKSNTMAAYDALPPDARRWLIQAALPWSARSVARLWGRALRDAKGDRVAAMARLHAAERRLLERDAPRVWGDGYLQAKG
jgi:hypothetical protein